MTFLKSPWGLLWITAVRTHSQLLWFGSILCSIHCFPLFWFHRCRRVKDDWLSPIFWWLSGLPQNFFGSLFGWYDDLYVWSIMSYYQGLVVTHMVLGEPLLVLFLQQILNYLQLISLRNGIWKISDNDTSWYIMTTNWAILTFYPQFIPGISV